jgi:HK97 family phage prohead protease
MTVEEDQVGLRFTCELPNTTYAKDLVESLKRGDIRGCSFGFRLPVGGDEWRPPTGDQPRARYLKECELLECSLVSIPVYPETEVALRSLRNHQSKNVLLALEVAKLMRRR